jgi:phage gpG-like protein
VGALEALDGLARALQTAAKLETIGGMAAEMMRGHIHGGEGFAPLSPATEAYRGAGRPLQDTGALRDSITFKVVDERTVSVGTNKPYAAIQNDGGVIRAKKEWLWIPGPGLRKIQRRKGSGYGISDVLNYYKSRGFSIYRRGRSIGYNEKRRSRNAEGKLEYKYHILYILKKSVEIPARKFFYLTEAEINIIAREVGSGLEQL